MGATKLMTAAGGGITLDAASTATDKTITVPADNGTLVYANSSGNVGIGTSSPSGAKVQIVGDNSALRVGDGTRDMYVDPDSGGIFLSNGAGQTGEGFYLAASGNTLRMYTSSTERARFDSSGNFLIGTSSAISSSKVAVSCSMNAFNGLVMQDTGSTGGNYVQFLNSVPAQAGAITHNGATTVLYTTSSDHRLKRNVASMTGALEKIAQLRPVTFNWASDGSEGEGFIAHELQEVKAGAVAGEKDAVDADGNPVYQGVDTSFLVATLTAAIQELKAELDAAKADIAALKGTV